MAWEISLHSSEERSQATKDLPARSVQQVKSIVTSYFPEIDWAHWNYGTCAYGDGEIEFEINGDPPDGVWLRVHNTDPTIELIALARTLGWLATNDSTGEQLENEVPFSESDVSRFQEAANRQLERLNVGIHPKRKMPRIKSKVPLADLKPEWILKELSMVSLRDGEVTLDLFEEYGNAMRECEAVNKLKGHPCFGPNEVVLPDGRRFSAIIMSRIEDAVNQFYDAYWKQSSRSIANLIGNEVVVDDGTKFPSRECIWVERASGRGIRT